MSLICITEIDECLSSPCKHGGTCKDEINGYKCTCRKGILGKDCEKGKHCVYSQCMS